MYGYKKVPVRQLVYFSPSSFVLFLNLRSGMEKNQDPG